MFLQGENNWFAAESLPSRRDFWRAATGEFRFMAENHNNHRKAAAGKNGRHARAQRSEHKAAKKTGDKDGRGKSGPRAVASGNSTKANGRNAAHSPAGTLFVIGGAEDRHDTKIILSRLAERIGSSKLVISTLASDYGDELWEV